ncbi:OLC1v1003125C1 [Oldenlandia corymbosa var. corymbosa]|uniref:4-hydroxy-3-methylbut-2-enyl diphosphate reductase n=1 Tax=Oldenlandia corymbosa var. corymbosa TaxID=529605 RepID=A0AAV1D9B3_OLDCO|nr:OLC1v1003125C1 [Oldenlandia corymbosa var. corymbosa]
MPHQVLVIEQRNPKKLGHNQTRSNKYNRKGFGHKEETLQLMNRDYTSKMIKTLKENGFEYTWGVNVTVRLAEAYGFCWGVERTVQIAYEARKQFPAHKIWLTNEILHSPLITEEWQDALYKLLEQPVGKSYAGCWSLEFPVTLPSYKESWRNMEFHHLGLILRSE